MQATSYSKSAISHWTAGTLLTIALFFCGTSHAAAKEFKISGITIDQVWSRATPKGAKVGAGYLKITNSGSTADRLVSAKSSVAGRVEIHTMTMDNGIMRMRRLKDGLELPPGKTVELKPGGRHLMFIELVDSLKKGQPFKATLVFEKAGEVELEFGVAAIGAKSLHGGKGNGHGHAGHMKSN